MVTSDLEVAVRNACFAADSVAIGFQGTEAGKTKAIIQRSLEFLIGNNIVDLKPKSEWPEWMTIDPPYDRSV